ncbi:DUF3047 domain-containing protein [Allosphingosinicella humi]
MILVAAALAMAPVWVGRFEGAGEPPPPWRIVRMSRRVRPTSYRIVDNAVEANADNSMALLARPIAVDLAATPILCWRWRIDAPVATADMARRGGDDYAARVYVAFDMPDSAISAGTRRRLALARTLFGRNVPDAALNYVWDNRHPVGTHRKSVYTSRAELIVQETGTANAGRWTPERADVAADFARAFGGKPGTPIQLALATDTDNTHGKARALFADLHFVGRNERCA